MSGLIFLIVCVGSVLALAVRQASLWIWAGAVAALTILGTVGLPFASPVMEPWGFGSIIGGLLVVVLCALALPFVRQPLVISRVYHALKPFVPSVSGTEREALEAGTVGWDAELFSGKPDWSRLQAVDPIVLTDEEKAFLKGPTEDLCRCLDDWEIRHQQREIPEAIWRFVAEKGFLGMLISKEHGGLGFSAQAQSLILGKIASRSADAVTIVMVPNSLGPGELIEKYGTDRQKSHYLPRLARGEEIPCFGLTGPTSGSDAATMRDIGTVCEGDYQGKKTLGIRLTWEKRYISLGPKATLLGLAFRLFDPDERLGKGSDVGITLALIPTDHPGVEIGRRHLPCGAAFPNGPNWGRDVFIPIDWVIGGAEGAGDGWRMLMECLSAGRSISLPSSSTAASKAMLRASTAYGRIRKQFGLPIAFMEGVEEPLARLVEAAYVTESARSVTASMVTAGEKPAVISALLKYQSTEIMRRAVNDALDIHGGKGICDGPSNYIQAAYQMVPVAITVEGANILTRTLITFAQGALRSHPWLYREIEALGDWDEDRGIAAFDKAFCGHVAFAVANIFGSLLHNLTGGRLASAPRQAGATRAHYRQLARASRSFALVADMTVALLGGGLKTKQKITGRLADALSELYLLSCVLKRFEDDGAPETDLEIVDYCARNCLYRFELAMAGVLQNFPIRWAGLAMRPLLFPFGARRRPAPDRQGKKIVRLALEPGEVRDRLTRDIFISEDLSDPAGLLEHAYRRVIETHEVDRRLEKAVRSGDVRRYLTTDPIAEAVEQDILTDDEGRSLREVKELVAKVISVDHFDPADIVRASDTPNVESFAAE